MWKHDVRVRGGGDGAGRLRWRLDGKGIGAVAGGLWLLLAASPATAQHQCEFQADRELTLPTGSVDALEITAGSGYLLVEGTSSASEIRVSATLCASSEERLEALEVVLERSGSEAVLDTDYPDWNDWGGRNQYARIDLEVEVPAGLDLHVKDGSGEAELRGVGSLTIQDGSGSLDLIDIGGDLDVRDGSGGLHIRGVRGDVEVRDGSGGLEIDDVAGSVRVSDGSGSVDIRSVDMDVVIARKGSGMIDVQEVGGDLTVEDSRRERVRYRDVQGAVDLPPERRRRRNRGG